MATYTTQKIHILLEQDTYILIVPLVGHTKPLTHVCPLCIHHCLTGNKHLLLAGGSHPLTDNQDPNTPSFELPAV